MIISIILLIIGFICLIKGADWFVDGASAIAKKLRVPSMMIGLTVVACGTSLPEAVVSLISSAQGANEMAISNVTGSNFFNLFMIAALCAAIHPLVMDKVTLKRDFPVAIGGMILIAFLACDLFIFGKGENVLGRIDGIILLVLFLIYMFIVINHAKKERKGHLDDAFDEELIQAAGFSQNIKVLFGSKEKYGKYTPSFAWNIIAVIVGAICIAGGGELVVTSATNIAATLGLSQTLIGLTIASIGTSLPELVTSVAAITKGEYDLALGNCIGSNVFNAFFVLGIAATVSPVGITVQNLLDIGILVAASLIIWILTIFTKKLHRVTGICMLVFYAAFFAFIIIR